MGKKNKREFKKEAEYIYKTLINAFTNYYYYRLSRWVICDSLLSKLDENVFRNTAFSQIQFPLMPK